MSLLFPGSLDTALDTNGNPISGATWNFYKSGTSTAASVYSDDTLSTSLGATVTANSAGRFVPIYLPAIELRAILKDASGVTIKDIDPINGEAGTFVTLQQYGAVCDGTTDDYAAIMSAHDNAPDGATILVQGAVRFATGLAFTRRLNWICQGPRDYFKPDVGTSADGITFTGGATTGGIKLILNVFSGANTCRSGVVLRNLHYSEVELWGAAGGTAYNLELLGCLENKITLRSSVNYTTPLGSPHLPPNHLKVDTYGGIKSNANDIFIYAAGKTLGVVVNDQSGEGNNTFRGVIQGLSSAAFVATGCQGMKLTELHLEGNPGVSSFTNCTGLAIENVLSALCGGIALVNCTDTYVNEYIGGLSVDAACEFTTIGVMRLNADETLTNASNSTQTLRGISTATSANVLSGGAGGPPMDNIFHNPFVDIWTAGTSSAPDGFSAVAATFARSTSNPYAGNPRGTVCEVTSTATAVGDALKITPAAPYDTYAEERWVSVMVPVYVATGQPNLVVTIFDGASHIGGETVTTKDSWVVVRAAVRVAASATSYVSCAPHDGSAYVAGNFRVGGCSIVNGLNAPRYLTDSGRRSEHVVTSVANAPAFIGQRAVSGSTWYMANGTASSANWIALN